MKLILSPTKTMDFDQPDQGFDLGCPWFEKQAQDLIRILSQMSAQELQALLNTSDLLTQKTLDQIRGFETAPQGPALFVFKGEAFKTLNPGDFTNPEIAAAQDRLRIFSGLYGLLRPLDRIRPYRLDLNIPLKVNGQSLKTYWQGKIIPLFEKDLAPTEPILNLASKEYAALLKGSSLAKRMISLEFLEAKTFKTIPVRAKQARGRFARAVIQKGIKTPQEIKDLVIDSYVYSADRSSRQQWCFVRREDCQTG